MLAEREAAVLQRLETIPVAAERILEEREGKGVVSRRHGRVRREDRGGANTLERRLEGDPGGELLAKPLEHHEGHVAFVGMPDGGLDRESAEQPHAADPE